ncbi:saccharopine dehydrogenase family protein [Geopsychrobacter electrodiphilus]|uniref:saccharopine dehydrogenase family protein n=1 Tax=Geopsychrobacter electrodiphilus TaxID=225196 RepID=UPI0003625BC8|nr:saccharopine dehydrogenase C-terminal domain-containing protein [Geopsychrobacter electrodiphilus]
MKVLLLGMGLQGKAVAQSLEKSPLVKEILVLDNNLDSINKYVAEIGFKKITTGALNAKSESELHKSVSQSGADLVIMMLPVEFGSSVARAALDAGIHFVSSGYAGEIALMDREAKAKGVIMLPEMGLDPGIDLILGGIAVGMLDRVDGLYSYGGGVPEPAHKDDNPLSYKISWSFEGVLKAYARDAVVIREGEQIDIPGNSIFKPENTHMVDIAGLGSMEAYPNGDAAKFISAFGLDKNIRHMGRFALRWPGHCGFWGTMADLGLLADKPADTLPVSPREFLVKALSPKLQYADGEKDIVIIRVEAWGEKDGVGKRVTWDLIDSRDLETGLFAMNRTVGYTTAIAAKMILSGKINAPGVLSPIKDVPTEDFLRELELVGIRSQCRVEDIDLGRYEPTSTPVA